MPESSSRRRHPNVRPLAANRRRCGRQAPPSALGSPPSVVLGLGLLTSLVHVQFNARPTTNCVPLGQQPIRKLACVLCITVHPAQTASNGVMSKQTVDDFLKTQYAPPTSLRATIEATSSPDAVRITPVSRDGGCPCGSSLDIPKSAILEVIATDEYRLCCGVSLRIVNVEFVPEAAILHSVFAQLATRVAGRAASARTEAHDALYDPNAEPRRFMRCKFPELDECYETCQSQPAGRDRRICILSCQQQWCRFG